MIIVSMISCLINIAVCVYLVTMVKKDRKCQ